MLKKSTALRNILLGKKYNKLTNGSFEDTTYGGGTPPGWTADASTLSVVSGGVNDTNCLKIVNSGSAAGSASQTITVRNGEIYEVEGYVKAGAAGVEVKITNSDGSKVYYDQTFNATEWTKFNTVFISEDTSLKVSFISTTSNQDDDCYVDEVKAYSLYSALRDIFTGGKIRIYTGSQPSSADDAPTGTLLVEINPSGGLKFEEPDNGTLSKKSDQSWSGTAVAEGTAGWFRLMVSDDDESGSGNYPRLDGAVATSGAELNMSNTYITTGSIQTISTFNISISE